MWPVSQAFLDAVRSSHTVVVQVEAWLEDSKIADLYPTGGSVSIDSRRATRRTISLAVADVDGDLIPGYGGATGVLSPFGTELRAYRGVRFDDGTIEVAPLGVFVVTAVAVTESDGGREVSVEGVDRSIRITRNRLVNPYVIDAGTSVEDAITGLLRDRWSDVETDLPETGSTTQRLIIGAGAESNAWAAAVGIAEAYGFDLAFDADGVVRMRTVPDPSVDDPVQVYEDGAEAVLLEVSRTFDAEGTYNGVIASSQASGTDSPVRAEAWDEDPNSPTFRYGPFGEVPRFYSSSMIADVDQAETVAESLLLKELGQSEAVEWGQVVNPAHDVLDLVRLTRPVLQLDAVLLIDRLEVPLEPDGTMTAVARVRDEEAE